MQTHEKCKPISQNYVNIFLINSLAFTLVSFSFSLYFLKLHPTGLQSKIFINLDLIMSFFSSKLEESSLFQSKL